jgi:hypothetical protein
LSCPLLDAEALLFEVIIRDFLRKGECPLNIILCPWKIPNPGHINR